MNINKLLTATALAAVLGATPAAAQMFGDQVGTDYNRDTFATGFGETGYYDAWDMNNDAGLSENEFASGIYSDWDTNNDLRITEDEFGTGAERWYGADYGTSFSDYDVDDSGYINQEEFGSNWDNEYYSTWDTDNDSLLSEDEYSTGLYNSADLDENEVLTIQEEGWFEGWFDGDDVEAEIQEVGEVL